MKQHFKKGNRKDSSRTLKIFLYCTTIILFVLLLFYILISFYYKERFYLNTMVNGVSVSNMTVSEVEEVINQQKRSYVLTLKGRNNLIEEIKGEDIDLITIFDDTLPSILNEQTGFQWPTYLIHTSNIDIETLLEFNEDLLKSIFDGLKGFDSAHSIEPINATISSYGENGYEIIPEDLGAKLKKDALYERIVNAIHSLEPSLDLEEEGFYEEPEINSKSPKLVQAVEEMNKLAGTKITYEFGEDIEVLDGSRINEWITVDEDYLVNLDTEGVKEFVDYIGKNYNTFGKTRTFKTSYGNILQIKGGDYGWWLNRGEEVEELTELIRNGEEIVKEPVYYQTASQYGDDDIGDTYVEVNLTAQHLFFYREGELIVESDFVSGNLSKNYGTPTGTYPIQYRERDATLNGEDYSTPVNYWMPFNHNIGFHDALWRNKFGGDIYMKKGSHGCINMPYSAAKTMYENIERGVAVIVYELPGTENNKNR